MTAISFDTHEFVKKLKEAGFTEQQAEALTETIKAAQGVDLSDLVTKNDLTKELAHLDPLDEMGFRHARRTRRANRGAA